MQGYNKQSKIIFWLSIGSFIIAVGIGALIYSFNFDIKQEESIYIDNLFKFAPSFILTLIGTALLRHDWKIRQLAEKLSQQQRNTDTSASILKASLILQQNDDMPDNLLETSFAEVKRALLIKQELNSNYEIEQNNESANILDIVKLASKNNSK